MGAVVTRKTGRRPGLYARSISLPEATWRRVDQLAKEAQIDGRASFMVALAHAVAGRGFQARTRRRLKDLGGLPPTYEPEHTWILRAYHDEIEGLVDWQRRVAHASSISQAIGFAVDLVADPAKDLPKVLVVKG